MNCSKCTLSIGGKRHELIEQMYRYKDRCLSFFPDKKVVDEITQSQNFETLGAQAVRVVMELENAFLIGHQWEILAAAIGGRGWRARGEGGSV